MAEQKKDAHESQMQILHDIAEKVENDISFLGTINCNKELSIDTRNVKKDTKTAEKTEEIVHRIYFSKKTGAFAKEKLLQIEALQDKKTGILNELNLYMYNRSVFSIISNTAEHLSTNYKKMLDRDSVHLIKQF